MADFVSSEARSRIMRGVKGRGNRTTELTLARALKKAELGGWRRHTRLPGRPDFAWREARIAVFVDGCFWHGCPRHYRAPTSNRAFWASKAQDNRRRDRRVSRRLRDLGWCVIRVWECRVTQPQTLARIARALAVRESRAAVRLGMSGDAQRVAAKRRAARRLTTSG